ncbi:Kv channel-interacting protein 4-like isoform X2 [Anopheles stephensi]|uniref:Kv channel-interacting protein 4-like isoform X2 n=1 Tax=Anopheles stephensi TaxID=30069 RepID=UPI0016587E7B|nr:Kv channel-interacting protein 4-like isoform X2 [Anopheles stephensi]
MVVNTEKLGGRTPPRPSELARRQGSIADKACATVETSQRTLAVRMCGRGRLGTTVLDWCYRTIERLLFRPADDWPSEPVNGAVEGAAAITLTAPETLDSNGRVYRRQRRRRDAIALELLTGKEPEAEDLPVPARYYPDSLVELTRTARFTEEEIKRIYRGFKAECPTGIVKEETFKGIYSQFFPLGASSGQYAHYVFNSIDLDRNGSLSFEEFVANLSILLRGTVDEKLQWTFSLYDINGDGCITKEEMKEIVTAIYELMGKVPEGCEEEQAIKEKVERLFEKMDRNCDGKITLDEFIECCTKDESIRRSIAVFDTIF